MKLKQILTEQGITYKQLAKVLEIDKPHVCRLANGKCLPTVEQARRMCEFLGCKLLDIYSANELLYKMPL